MPDSCTCGEVWRGHPNPHAITCPATPQAPHSFAIGSDVWPGLSKLVEECGEVAQVVGKLMATGGVAEHWDGTNLHSRLLDELADLRAAIGFVIDWSYGGELTPEQYRTYADRVNYKRGLFEQWHLEQQGVAVDD